MARCGNTPLRREPPHGSRPRRRRPRFPPGPIRKDVVEREPRKNVKGARARVTASRLWVGGVLRGVVAPAGSVREVGKPISRSETRRTPGPAAGCNKPVSRRAEKTVEVVRNHEGGTGLRGWSLRGRRWLATGSGRAADVSAEGRRAGARRVTVWCMPTPREEAGLPAGAKGEL